MVDSDKQRLSQQRERLHALLDQPTAELNTLVAEVHPADLAEWMLDLDSSERWTLFERLDGEGRGDLLEEVEDEVAQEFLARTSPEQLTEIIEELPSDEGADLLSVVEPGIAEQVLSGLDAERSGELRELIAYPADTAGGLMTVDYVSVEVGSAISDAIKLLKQEGDEVEEGVGIFVLDSVGKPIGYVPIRSLLAHSIHDLVDEAMFDVHSIDVAADQEEAAIHISKYSLRSLAVVNASGILLGVITSDDAQEVLEDEASEDMMRLVGTAPVGGGEPVLQTRLSILMRVRYRIPLQAVTVLGGLLTAWILDQFIPEAETASGALVADLLRFLPIVIGLAGNVGVQSSTILVRAFATGEVEEERELSVLFSEVMVGLLIGLLCGTATGVVAIALGAGGSSMFGIAVGTAIGVAVTWAAFLGCVVPLSCRRLGIDPAVVAGPFLITMSDISGAVIFFGFGSFMLDL